MKHFIKLQELPMTEAMPDAFLAAVQTENLTLAYSYLKAGAAVPLHHHPEEAVDIILDGLLEMEIDNRTDTLSSGMMSVVPSNIPHQAKAITDCKVLSVFFPQRDM